MSQSASHSASGRNYSNGTPVIRVERKGKRLFALGDDPPVEIDVVLVYNQWMDIDRQYRNDKGEVATDKLPELNLLAIKFVSEIFQSNELTMAEVLNFFKLLFAEVNKLRDFFEPDSPGGLSSPGRMVLTTSE